MENKEELIKKAETGFLELLKSNNVKYKSVTYYKYQYVYFNAAITILGEIPPKWGIALMAQREIIEPYKL